MHSLHVLPRAWTPQHEVAIALRNPPLLLFRFPEDCFQLFHRVARPAHHDGILSHHDTFPLSSCRAFGSRARDHKLIVASMVKRWAGWLWAELARPRLTGWGATSPERRAAGFLVIACRYLFDKEVATRNPAGAVPVRAREQHTPQGSQIDRGFDGQAAGRVGTLPSNGLGVPRAPCTGTRPRPASPSNPARPVSAVDPAHAECCGNPSCPFPPRKPDPPR
jgi:hypothetical protein